MQTIETIQESIECQDHTSARVARDMEEIKANLWFERHSELDEPDFDFEGYRETPSFASFGSPYSTLRRERPNDLPSSSTRNDGSGDEQRSSVLETGSSITTTNNNNNNNNNTTNNNKEAQRTCTLQRASHDNDEVGTHHPFCDRPWYILGFSSLQELREHQAGADTRTANIKQRARNEPKQKQREYENKQVHPAFFIFLAMNKICSPGKKYRYINVEYPPPRQIGLLQIQPFARKRHLKDTWTAEQLLTYWKGVGYKPRPKDYEEVTFRKHRSHVRGLYLELQLQHWNSGLNMPVQEAEKQSQTLQKSNAKWYEHIESANYKTQPRRYHRWYYAPLCL